MGKEKTAEPTEAEELPKTIVRRLVKDKLSELSTDGGDVILHKEALLAFSESARIFIHYLSATAHDVCNESKRQIINADDVMKALEEIEFSEFVEPLKAPLDEFRKKAAEKRVGSAKAKEASKKRKTDENTTTENGKDKDKADNEAKDVENGVEDEEEDDDENENENENENGNGNGEQVSEDKDDVDDS
ncbi:DNA polymerase epsilon subunit 3 [Bienertia sinuspersici]